MTRINVGIPVKKLSDKHLLAEHREIKRIPNLVKAGRLSNKNQPEEFTLGTGHVKFFYDKLGFLLNRYKEIYEECLRRSFNVQDFSSAWEGIDPCLMNDYQPTPKAIKLIEDRILERSLPAAKRSPST